MADAPKKFCFVVGPIGAEDSADRIHSDWLLETIIQPVMTEFPDFETKRADQITTPGMIDAQVINALLTADLIIADMSTRNPNAFYEIGIRHMAQKPIIHMQLTDENIPFDVSLYRAIKYSRARPRDLRAAQNALKAQIIAITSVGYQVDNPITRTHGILELNQRATSTEKVMLDELRALRTRIANLEKQPAVARALEAALDSTSMITITSRRGFDDELLDHIRRTIETNYGTYVQIAKSGNELVLLIPGVETLNDLRANFADLKDIHITFMPPPHS